MKFFLLFFSFFHCFTINAQFGNTKSKHYKELEKSILYVVLDNEPSLYNTTIQENMDHLWKFSEINYIKRNELKKSTFSSNKFILDIIPISRLIGNRLEMGLYKDRPKAPVLALIKTNKKGEYDLHNILAQSYLRTPSGSENVFETISENEIKAHIKRSVVMIQQFITVCKKTNIANASTTYATKICNHYTTDYSEIKKSKLLLIEEDYNPKKNTKNIKKIYPYKFKIASNEQIAEAILNKEKGVVYEILLQDVKFDARFIFFVRAEDNKILYASSPPNFNKYLKRFKK